MASAQAALLTPLTKERLIAVGRELGIPVDPAATKPKQVDVLSAARFEDVVQALMRDELRAACRALKVPDQGRDRGELIERIAKASSIELARREGERREGTMPRRGDVALVRHRQYLVEDVEPALNPGDVPSVKLVCLDDDAQGRRVEVLWGKTELGAKILDAEGSPTLGTISRIDSPRTFGAYLHALKWNCVTATDARLFQSPFRAGIKLIDHQLTPLKKALELPRVNLFIADDVGLGKTIEAGLVVQELILRQRVDYVVVVCPASVSLQWRDEMEKRFGLRFELYNREFVGRRRRERGFGVNPWTTHNRFIISYQTFRRPEYRDPLLQHLGDHAKKTLLVLDEAHTAAPSSASRYATDSEVTISIRHLAERFENRLFLSATPHNGHSNSFSSLLEILDPQRFTRGVKIRDPRRLEPVMVRRLKTDLRGRVSSVSYPERRVIPVSIRHEDGKWRAWFGTKSASADGFDTEPVTLDAGEACELKLAKMLSKYTVLARPDKGRGRLVFSNLQKRLLSSVEAFYRTLKLHADNVGKKDRLAIAKVVDDDEQGVDDETQEELAGLEVAAASREVDPKAEARKLLDEMLDLAGRHRSGADGKVLALLEWIRRNQCEGVRLGGGAKNAKWSERRVIIFTEWGDTKRWLLQLLTAAIEGTHRAEGRILQLHGGMSDESRNAVQEAFNSRPRFESKNGSVDPLPARDVRILLATDSAREGINLQGHCADLFHFDVPWNPARMEQRNGRIDRTLQPSPEVRCHYFLYPQREEDPVLDALVVKVERIQKELGSLSDVILTRFAEELEEGIDATASARLDKSEKEVESKKAATKEELESFREKKRLAAEIDEVAAIKEESKKVLDFREELLRDALDVGVELAGASPLKRGNARDGERDVEVWTLPKLPDSWASTLDSVRPARAKDESLNEWRQRDLLPVVFTAPDRMNSDLAHLHLQHPLVQRVLSRFLSQGHSAFDLSRVTIVRSKRDQVARAIAFGRVSLFGPGGVRLHDRLIPVAAKWTESKGKDHLKPFRDEADRQAVAQLEESLQDAPSLDGVSRDLQSRLAKAAPDDFAALWTEVKKAADTEIHEAILKLRERGRTEADAMREILESQRNAIEKELGAQLTLDFGKGEEEQHDQFEKDKQHMKKRLAAIERELESEPEAIRSRYEVALRRVTPVGLVYLWPASR